MTEHATRFPDVIEGELPADLDLSRICYWRSNKTVDDSVVSTWWLYLPAGGIGRLSDHEVEEHVDGKITVSPSILMTSTLRSGGVAQVRHGYLERGVWREV